jgi:hypothetical protein
MELLPQNWQTNIVLHVAGDGIEEWVRVVVGNGQEGVEWEA